MPNLSKLPLPGSTWCPQASALKNYRNANPVLEVLNPLRSAPRGLVKAASVRNRLQLACIERCIHLEHWGETSDEGGPKLENFSFDSPNSTFSRRNKTNYLYYYPTSVLSYFSLFFSTCCFPARFEVLTGDLFFGGPCSKQLRRQGWRVKVLCQSSFRTCVPRPPPLLQRRPW